MGPRAGQRVFTLQTAAAQGEGEGQRGAVQSRGLPRHVAMRWAQRLKRAFGIETESCASGHYWVRSRFPEGPLAKVRGLTLVRTD